MPWPRPRRALCFLCVASCESVASSFGVNSVLAAAAAKAGPAATSRAASIARAARGGAGANSSGASSLGTASGGAHDGGGGGGGSGRQGVSAVQAVAEVQPVTAPEDLAKATADVMEQRESLPEPPPYAPPPPPPPPPPPSLEDANDRAPTRTWNVGRPNATSMMSLARFKLWWMMPKHSSTAQEVPPETQMMLTKLQPDPETGRQLYGLFIPLIDGQAKCSLKGLPDRSLQLFAETGCPDTPVPSSDVAGLYIGVDEDPFKLVEKSFKLVNARLRNQVKAGSFGAGGLVPGLVLDAEKQLSRWKKSEVISKKVDNTSPDFSNYLGWCTWDSFYTSVDHDKVFKGLTSLREAGIRPKWLVLDDGWQSTSNSDAANGEQWMDHLTSIKANDKFRDEKQGTDLSRTVKKVNFLGPGNGGSVMLSRAFHSALSKSVRKHFPDSDGEKGEGGRIIHCMCHDSEILLQLPACYGRQPVIRGSDDFYPRDRGSHSPHIYANAYNGLMISNCGLQDWDMFQTNIGEASWMHAAARAVSGGPVYISDRPGDHNTEILRRMVLEDGGVLKPPANALPCLRSLFVDPQREEGALLSIWNEGEADGHGVVAVFNLYGSAWSQGRRTYAPVRTSTGALSGAPVDNGGDGVGGPPPVDDDGVGGVPEGVEGGVRPSDCHRLLRDERAAAAAAAAAAAGEVQAEGGAGVDRGQGRQEPEGEYARYALHFHFADRLMVGGLHDEHPLVLSRGRSEVAAISKVLTFDVPSSGKGEWASVGLADMFNAGGAVASETLSQEGGRAQAELMVKGSGRFLALCSHRPAAVVFDGVPLNDFSHRLTDEGVPYLEIQLPWGYTGTPRSLVVRWDKDSRAESGVLGGIWERVGQISVENELLLEGVCLAPSSLRSVATASVDWEVASLRLLGWCIIAARGAGRGTGDGAFALAVAAAAAAAA
eukprot:g15436.t1